MTEKELNDFLSTLGSANWQVKLRDGDALHLRESFTSRYSRIPEDYRAFLQKVAFCANATDTVWFLCEADYNGESDSAFKWNEFELQSLETTDGDEQLTENIKRFWDCHLPFAISVKSGYAFLAVCVCGKEYGQIVAGLEPEYEEVVEVCNSFSEFVRLFSSAIKKEIEISVLDDFI